MGKNNQGEFCDKADLKFLPIYEKIRTWTNRLLQNSTRDEELFMKQKFEFTDIDGESHMVEFEVIHNEGEYRVYGIRACMTSGGVVQENAEVRERFITLAEAEATLGMLCECQVMPCTLRDVI